MDLVALWEDLKAVLRTYLDLPEPAYGLLAAWAIGTYFCHAFAAYPFLHCYGPKNSGKSKTLEALWCVCFNAWKGRDITAAALGDTVDGQRGTVLVDQAEHLPEHLVGLMADSYKRAGGKRRIIDTSNGGRSLLEFSTYGPKAFASQKRLDPDLEDRCIRIKMVRTRKPLPDLEGFEPVWKDLRDQLYRFALTHFLPVGLGYEGLSGNGTRVRELWRPMGGVLWALKVEETEVAAIRELFMGSVQETQNVPTGWELTLLEVLKEKAETVQDTFELTTEDILVLMDIQGENKPGGRWVGDALAKFSLYEKALPRRHVEGRKRKVAAYLFRSEHVLRIYEIYCGDTLLNEASQASQDENGSESNGFRGTNSKCGTGPNASQASQEAGSDPGDGPGRTGTGPTKTERPTQDTDMTDNYEVGWMGRSKSGGMAKENFNFFESARPAPPEAVLHFWDPERQRRAAAIVNQCSAPMEELFSGDEVKL